MMYCVLETMTPALPQTCINATTWITIAPRSRTLNQRVRPRAYMVSILGLCFPSSYTFCIRDRLAPSIVSPLDYFFAFVFQTASLFRFLVFFGYIGFPRFFLLCALNLLSVLLLLLCSSQMAKGGERVGRDGLTGTEEPKEDISLAFPHMRARRRFIGEIWRFFLFSHFACSTYCSELALREKETFLFLFGCGCMDGWISIGESRSLYSQLE